MPSIFITFAILFEIDFVSHHGIDEEWLVRVPRLGIDPKTRSVGTRLSEPMLSFMLLTTTRKVSSN